ncbi:rCG23756, partial [Rattus norvegicus]
MTAAVDHGDNHPPNPSETPAPSLAPHLRQSTALQPLRVGDLWRGQKCLPSQDPTVTNIQRKSPLRNRNGILTLNLVRLSMKPTSKSMCQGGPLSREIHPCPKSAAPRQTLKK